MSYSTNPVLDQMRHQEKVDWAERMRAHREKTMYFDTVEMASKGDYTRLFEAMDYRDNDRVVLDALVACANSGNLVAKRAINTLAKTYAQLFSEPA